MTIFLEGQIRTFLYATDRNFKTNIYLPIFVGLVMILQQEQDNVLG